MDYAQQLVDALEDHGDYSPRTIRFYREQCGLVLRALSDVDPHSDPKNLDEPTLKSLVRYMRSKYAVSTQKDYLVALKRMCEINGNNVFSRYRLTFPSDTRPNVDWLTTEQAQNLLNMDKSPLDDMIVTLELLHGLRRVETARLCISDIHIDKGYMDVRGKGRGGGKYRSVPLHPDFIQAYNRWMEERDSMQSMTEGKQPDNLLIYLRKGKLRPYEEIKGRAMDDRIHKLSERMGVIFSNHTLRRTFGREMYRSGVDIVVIASIYGHVSTSQTMKYLGLEMDDMSVAMDKLRLRRVRVRNGIE